MPPQLLEPCPYFADLPDPRRETQNKLHKLHDILMMVRCTVLSGVEDWVGIQGCSMLLNQFILRSFQIMGWH